MGMGKRDGSLLHVAPLAAAILGIACTHVSKVPITEVPINQFEATAPPPASTETIGPPPLIDETAAPSATSASPVVSAATSSATPSAPATATAGGAGGAAAPTNLTAPTAGAGTDADSKIQAATKLMKSGKRPDLLAARKILGADVFNQKGTADEARLLRLVCTKLGDKPCVATATQYANTAK